MSQASIGLCLLHSTERYLKTVPIKLFEYMACSIPVIASNFQQMSKIIEKERCGILVDPTNPKEIAEAIIYLLDHRTEAKKMGRNGRKAIETRYNWEKIEHKLLNVYQNCGLS